MRSGSIQVTGQTLGQPGTGRGWESHKTCLCSHLLPRVLTLVHLAQYRLCREAEAIQNFREECFPAPPGYAIAPPTFCSSVLLRAVLPTS